MPSALPLVLAAGMIGGAAAAAPSLPGPPFPRYASAAALTSACDSGLADAARRVKTLEKHTPDSRWLSVWDDLNASFLGPIKYCR